ncbi:hypothetical protein NQZ68_033676 [Dissostichus eleginoides]|nr:hypothetical protein NQZ68_033676 [Dissostichus eleginoides]
MFPLRQDSLTGLDTLSPLQIRGGDFRYDRNKLLLKEIHSVQYVSSFTINPRLQRHFSVFALSSPGAEALSTIYTSILSQLQRCPAEKLPPPVKFHYIFDLRDLSNIFQVTHRKK